MSGRAAWSSCVSSRASRSRRPPKYCRCPSRLPNAIGSPRKPGFRGRFAGSRPMQPERWRRIKELLDVGLRLDRGERSDYLARACGDDAELRDEVQSLIEAYEESGDV